MFASLLNFFSGSPAAAPRRPPSASKAGVDYINSLLPDELILAIFRKLKLQDLAHASETCRRWERIATDPVLWKAYVTVFGEPQWAHHVDMSKHGLSTEGFIPFKIPHKRLLSMLPLIEGGGRVTLVIIPKGLSVKKIEAMAKSPKEGNKMPFSCPPEILEPDAEVDQPYQIVITDHILEGTRSIRLGRKQALVRGAYCREPTALEAMVVLVVRWFMVDKQRFHSNNPSHYEALEGQVTKNHEVIAPYPTGGVIAGRHSSRPNSLVRYGMGGVLQES